MLASGKDAIEGGATYTYETYVFNSLDGTYSQKADIYKSIGGVSDMGCAIKPSNQNIILCVGGYTDAFGRRDT